MGRALGITERQLAELPRYEESDAFDADERLVLDLAVAMTSNPVEIPEGLRRRLDDRFTSAQFTELAAAIAWENHRARLNRALGVREVGFSDGAACALPETHPASPTS